MSLSDYISIFDTRPIAQSHLFEAATATPCAIYIYIYMAYHTSICIPYTHARTHTYTQRTHVRARERSLRAARRACICVCVLCRVHRRHRSLCAARHAKPPQTHATSPRPHLTRCPRGPLTPTLPPRGCRSAGGGLPDENVYVYIYARVRTCVPRVVVVVVVVLKKTPTRLRCSQYLIRALRATCISRARCGVSRIIRIKKLNFSLFS